MLPWLDMFTVKPIAFFISSKSSGFGKCPTSLHTFPLLHRPFLILYVYFDYIGNRHHIPKEYKDPIVQMSIYLKPRQIAGYRRLSYSPCSSTLTVRGCGCADTTAMRKAMTTILSGPCCKLRFFGAFISLPLDGFGFWMTVKSVDNARHHWPDI